jgi:hypothetical protein
LGIHTDMEKDLADNYIERKVNEDKHMYFGSRMFFTATFINFPRTISSVVFVSSMSAGIWDLRSLAYPLFGCRAKKVEVIERVAQ